LTTSQPVVAVVSVVEGLLVAPTVAVAVVDGAFNVAVVVVDVKSTVQKEETLL